ncbi:MAG: electron transport complex subunit RsxG [Rhodocyclaceae bacterium]|nr:electron transport complex subunit RsxG [Rhodocyclaceae bacterium]MDP3032482.1 electron transport complex subunit RsxG [Rhodocyclaceae bacterium]
MSDPNLSVSPAAPVSGALRISLRTAAILLLFTIAFTALMAQMYQLTRPIIETTMLDAKRRLIAEVLPAAAYDNDLLADFIELPPVAALGLPAPTRLYRARRAGQPVAMVMEAAAPDGYSGHIGLILAVQADGRLAAVRVTQHKETPGLGDYIDPKKDKNKAQPWITQFDGRHFGETPREKWRVKKDGGAFDQRAGATITARAVTRATGRALEWAQQHAAAIYALPSAATFKEEPEEKSP